MRWNPIDDLPLSRRRLAALSAGRLEPVVAALQGHLDAALSAAQLGAYVQRIGLFGGLGQGKSTVVNAACDAATAQWRRHRPNRNLPWQSPIARFDVSHFKADDLEWRFLTSVLLWRVLRSLAPWAVFGLIVFALLGLLASLVAPAFSPLGFWAKVAGYGAAVAVMAVLGSLAALYVTPLDWLCHLAAELTGTLPSVVVVDDLDRADRKSVV